MPLKFDYSHVRDLETTQEEQGLTNSIIYGTIFVGIPEITEENALEFYSRYHYLEKLNGPFMRKAGGEPYYLKLEDVTRRIGLKTNAGTMTRNQFIKVKTERFFGDIERSN